jgi:hypothetical protein
MPMTAGSRLGLLGLSALLAIAAPPVVLLSCRPPPMDPVGYSSVRAVGSNPPRDAGVRMPSPLADDFRDHMAKLMPRQLSVGHAARFDGVVWGNEAAKTAWEARGVMPDGAVLVEEVIDAPRVGDRAAGELYMEKKGGAWTFLAIGPDGATGSDTRCQGCHAEAPQDGVFRLDQLKIAASTAAMTATVPTPVATTAATTDARSAGRADASVSP